MSGERPEADQDRMTVAEAGLLEVSLSSLESRLMLISVDHHEPMFLQVDRWKSYRL